MLNGIDVAREFQLTGEQRQVKGDSFELLLLAKIEHGGEEPFPIIVDRRVEDGTGDTLQLNSSTLIVRTTARLTPDGESFGIDIMFIDVRRMKSEAAEVIVSKDMERIGVEERGKGVDSSFTNTPDL